MVRKKKIAPSSSKSIPSPVASRLPLPRERIEVRATTICSNREPVYLTRTDSLQQAKLNFIELTRRFFTERSDNDDHHVDNQPRGSGDNKTKRDHLLQILASCRAIIFPT